MNTKRYTASDVKNIIGMDRNSLFYCAKTLGLIIPIQKKPNVTLYDFYNLLDLALVHSLRSTGFKQRLIRSILGTPGSEGLRYIWKRFLEHREEYERDGCLLLLQRSTQDIWYMIDTLNVTIEFMKQKARQNKAAQPPPPAASFVIVDILCLVRRIEVITGESFGPERTP
jgi:DNA-binding transcriptional MerR regulator